MDVEELYRRYAAGERDFSGVNLSHADLNVIPIIQSIATICSLMLTSYNQSTAATVSLCI